MMYIGNYSAPMIIRPLLLF